MNRLWLIGVLLAVGCGSSAPSKMEGTPQEKPKTGTQDDGRKLLPIELVSRYRAESIPWSDPNYPGWKDAAPVALKLIRQEVQEPMLAEASIGELRVRSLHNDGWVAFLLEWDDPSKSSTLRSDRFGDACAVEFPLATDPMLPDYRMGDEGRAVHLMLWRAERQRAHEEKVSYFDENYPYAWTDAYTFEPKAVDYVTGQALLTEQKRYLAAQAAENPFRVGVAPPVEELGAQTWNKLTIHQHQDARGRGLWADGKWRVVIVRPIVTSDAEDASLEGKKAWPVAFAAWDGGRQNAGPRKMVVEGWIPLKLAR